MTDGLIPGTNGPLIFSDYNYFTTSQSNHPARIDAHMPETVLNYVTPPPHKKRWIMKMMRRKRHPRI